MLIDYAEHFWGDSHIGYHTLYENMKRGEDCVQELSTFVKERIGLEEELLKYYSKSLNRVNTYINNNGAFADAWRMTKGTLELCCEIETNVIKGLVEVSRDIVRYHDELVKGRKKSKEQDVIDAVNIMQTTTTCLQKAKETYQQRCNELISMKNDPQTKDVIKMKNKVAKAHDEYKSYVEKYGAVRENFVEKMLRATSTFQKHDTSHHERTKAFFVLLAKLVDECVNSTSQVTSDWRSSISEMDLENIMLRFVEEKGTGTERPVPIQWSDSDELIDLDSVSGIIASAPSSSSSSAIVAGTSVHDGQQHTANIIDLDSPAGDKSATDSETEGAHSGPSTIIPQFSSSIGRWLPSRRKKQNSQSSLPTPTTANTNDDSATTTGFILKRYRKVKNSINDLTPTEGSGDDSRSTRSSEHGASGQNDSLIDAWANNSSSNSADVATPTATHATEGFLVDAEGYTIRQEREKEKTSAESADAWQNTYSSSDEDDESFQASKIRQLQIKPAAESKSNIQASVDELRHAVGHIHLQKSSTFDRDPWASLASPEFTQSLNTGGAAYPIRQALTGDDHLRRNRQVYAELDFSQSVGAGVLNTIARARPRSQTPTALAASSYGIGMNTISSDDRTESSSSDVSSSMLGASSTTSMFAGFGDSFVAPTPKDTNSTPMMAFAGSHVPKHPIAIAVHEFVHAWFKPANAAPEVKIFGTVALSFPAILFPVLTDLASDVKPVTFVLTNASRIKTVMPNRKLLVPALPPTLPVAELSFTVDRLALASLLLDQKKAKPDAAFFNVDVVKYEVDPLGLPPLKLNAYWKTSDTETGIRVDYALTGTAGGDATTNNAQRPLINVTFTTQVNGAVELINADPLAVFDPGAKQLTWTVTELSPHGSGIGSLKARLRIEDGGPPSTPSSTTVHFQSNDCTLSGVHAGIDSTDSSYTLSMNRRKVVAGKYFCEPEIRN